MPLKHATETFLVFLLGVAIALAGLFTSTLPDLPDGAFPWAILLALTILYPLLFTRLFRRNRADYAFRWLHWFPVLIVALWMVLQIGSSTYESLEKASQLYTWGWSLPVVGVGIVAVAIFCLNVIRRRVPRITLLLVIFVPFVAVAIMSQRQYHWEGELASVLWEGEWLVQLQNGISGTGAGVEVAMKDSIDEKEEIEPDKNLEKSEDEAEEAWRERLRAFERRRQMIALQVEGEPASAEATAGREEEEPGPQETPSPDPKTGTGREFREAKTSPTSLPNAGGGIGFLSLTMMMAYCGVLHQRAKKRVS